MSKSNISQVIYENRYNKTISNKELQELLKQYPDNTLIAVEYCDINKMQYFPDKNLIAID